MKVRTEMMHISAKSWVFFWSLHMFFAMCSMMVEITVMMKLMMMTILVASIGITPHQVLAPHLGATIPST